MIKRFPVPRGLRSKSYASRYAQLRRLATRRQEARAGSKKLIPSDRPLKRTRPARDTSAEKFALILVATTMAFVALLICFG